MSFLNRDMSLTGDDPSDLFSPYSDVMDGSEAAADHTATGTIINDVNLGGWQSNPAMKGPRNMVARKTSGPLQHQRSAKALITRYESMSSSERHRVIQPPFRNVAGRSSHPSEHSRNTMNSLPIIEKDKSPIRQSFRNFFSVFRKGNAAIKEDIKDKTKSPPRVTFGGGESISLPGLSFQPTLDIPIVLPRVEFKDDTALYTGSLLYLSRVSMSPSTLPVWTTCTAILQSDRILITWITTHGNPFCHVISLTQCEDVRSVLLSQISPDERALLPTKGDSHDLRTFEILFEDRPTEKFAAASANERAGWVCAIWDAILPSREGKEIGSDEKVTTEDTGLIITNSVPQSQTKRAPGAAQSQGNLPPSSPRLDRSLPPTPIDTMPPTLPTHAEGISLHDLPHRPRSLNAISPSPPVSLTSSPSIANLGQLSVVKHRLAQIERTNTGSSSVGPPFLYSSRSKDNPTRLNGGLAENIRCGPLGLQHQTSLRSNDGDSIFDSYVGMSSPSGDCSVLIPTKEACRQNLVERAHPLVHRECDSLKAPWDAESPTGLLSPSSQYSATDEPTHTRLTEILQDDKRNVDQVANIGNHILLLQQDIQRLPEQLKTLVVDPKQGPLLEVIDQTARNIDQQAEETRTELRDLREILHGINETIRGQVPPVGYGSKVAAVNDTGSFQLLQGLHLNLESNLPEVLRKLGEIQDAQTLANQTTSHESPAVVMNNSKPSSQECKIADDAMVACMTEIHTKLDGLLALCDGRLTTLHSGNYDEATLKSSTRVMQVPEEVKEILALSKGNENHHNIQEHQQAECIRYLNELNSWLETFVNNGTSQIQRVATNVQQLCNTLIYPLNSMGTLEVNADGAGTLLRDIRQLLTHQERDDNAITLQDGHVAANKQNANVFTPELVVDLINRQRHDQEGLFRALAAELSDEIRGERLRFVEAMKSATSINVQLHVDQFKKELTREVLAMTQEVERLQQERHGIENQIADLLAFYSKQKQTGVPWTHSSPVVPSQNNSFRASPLRGPLPNPNSCFSRGSNRHY